MISPKVKNVVVVSVIVAVALLVAAYFVILGNENSPPPEEGMATSVNEEGLGAQLFDQSGNPADNLPETNPFNANTNPFSGVKTNPFK